MHPGNTRDDGVLSLHRAGVVPGLGRATVTYTIINDENVSSCFHFDFTTAVIDVAGRGAIQASLTDPKTRCWQGAGPAYAQYGPFTATVNGGSGEYEGASGSGAVRLSLIDTDTEKGMGSDTWSGTLTVPGRDFDVVPPVFSGAVSKTVRAAKGTRRMRVRFTVTANDTVDGSVPVTCKPPSGSYFRAGRTKVTCSATDSSGNTATATFTVTAK